MTLENQRPSKIPHCGILFAAVWVLASLSSPELRAASLTDYFTNREMVTASSGQIDGNNVGANIEVGEPQHANKPGGRSVWISWLAPTNGVATFWTDGSTFDTLLAAYYFGSTNDATLDKLHNETSNDDDPTRIPAHTSLIQFGAKAGRRYEIAIDGYRGAVGDIRLRWDFLTATSLPPVIVSVPDDRSARQGDSVTLSVDMQTSPDLTLQWRLNGNSFGAEGTTLDIPSLQPANVGRYTLRIDLGDVRFETKPVEVQINSDGQTNALARDKLFDALSSGLEPGDDNGGELRAASLGRFTAASIGVSRGYNGTQIFNTTYATPDPTEPQHCGLNGGASYWYAYQPPADGTMTLDTIGSSYDTFLAVYTYNAPFTSYADLIPITCDNDGAGTNGAARVEFAAPKNRQFLVVVDGINGARGTVNLNYRLDTNRPPIAPTLMQAPSVLAVALGMDVALQPEVIGSPPLHFAWRKGDALISGATNSALRLTNVTPAHSGDYFVSVSSHVGSPLDVLMPLRVLIPPQLQLISQQASPSALSFATVSGQRYFVDQTDALDHPWQAWTNSFPGDGTTIVVTIPVEGGTRFYRLRVE